jgi:hypothetical protein
VDPESSNKPTIIRAGKPAGSAPAALLPAVTDALLDVVF